MPMPAFAPVERPLVSFFVTTLDVGDDVGDDDADVVDEGAASESGTSMACSALPEQQAVLPEGKQTSAVKPSLIEPPDGFARFSAQHTLESGLVVSFEQG
ncbi:unnamed protein product [Alternaria alternata]